MRNRVSKSSLSFFVLSALSALAGCGLQIRGLNPAALTQSAVPPNGPASALAPLSSVTPSFSLIDAASDDRPEGMVVTASGEVVVAGTTGSNLFGASAGAVDYFIRKYDADGNVLWSEQYGADRTIRSIR